MDKHSEKNKNFDTKTGGCLNTDDTHEIKSCITCPIRNQSLLRDLCTSELETLNQDRSRKYYKAGDTIFREGDQPLGLMCMNTGKVKISKTGEGGNEMIIDLKKPVEFITINALLSGGEHKNSATAIEDTSLCVISKDAFFEVLNKNPNFSVTLLEFMAKKLGESEKRILNLTNKHMRARLAEALIIINRTYGMDENNTLNAELKRSELAALANMTPANAIRVLSAFVKEELVTTNKKKITIVNMEGLKEICKFGYTRKNPGGSKLFE